MQTALLTARPEELGPHAARTCGDMCASSPDLSEGMLGSLLPRVCISGFAVGSFYFRALSVTGIVPESDREGSGSDSFLFVSEDCGNGTDRSLLLCL